MNAQTELGVPAQVGKATLQAETIDEVIELMDEIINEAIIKRDRVGYFASLYRMVTVVVKDRAQEGGFFEDDDRMRYLDVVFANRYFEALDLYRRGEKPTESWLISFESARKERLLLLQHLLLGMNAHISLDLGIATAQVAQGDLNESLQRDFNRLNNLLAGLIDSVQDEVGRLSPFFRTLDRMGLSMDEIIVSFSINIARDRAWSFAQEISVLNEDDAIAQSIVLRDRKVAGFSRRLLGSARWYMAPLLWLANLRENKDVRQNVETLSRVSWESAVRDRVSAVLREARNKEIDLTKRTTQTIKLGKEADADQSLTAPSGERLTEDQPGERE